MTNEQVNLLPVDTADATILVDNSLDILMSGTEIAHRAPLAYDWTEREQLIAEHGYSLLLTSYFSKQLDKLVVCISVEGRVYPQQGLPQAR